MTSAPPLQPTLDGPAGEWAPQAAIWVGWPSAADLWEDNLAPAQAEVAALAHALFADGAGDRVRVLAAGAPAYRSARAQLHADIEVIETPFGDVWLRDTGPIFTANGDALRFGFNGWGGKYDLPGDQTVGDAIAAIAGAPVRRHDFILEGGAIEMDGAGRLITTRQCLLNPNRNAGWTQAAAEDALRAALGVSSIIWLDDGLANDHTDGHIDNLARFIGPGRVVCQAPSGPEDPNAAVLAAIARALREAEGGGLEVIEVPGPGLVRGADGAPAPASHMNFVISRTAVVVPIYNDRGVAAVEALAPLFPGRRVLGLASTALLSGGGSFHCITQHQPARQLPPRV